jgi:hypothetical protein
VGERRSGAKCESDTGDAGCPSHLVEDLTENCRADQAACEVTGF